MADIAELGFRVDSSQVKAATSDLQKLNTEAQKTEQRSGAIAAAAKREGVSYEEMAARYRAASANAKGLNDELGKAPAALNASSAAAKATGGATREAAAGVSQLRSGFSALSREASLLPGPIGHVARSMAGLGGQGFMPLALGLTGTVAAIAAVTTILGAAVSRYSEFEAQQARVTNAINATNNASKQSAASIESYVQAQSRSGTQFTGDIREAAAGLLRYREVAGSTFPEVLKLAQDVAATGFTDLKGATEALGKSLKDPTEASKELEAVGIRLSVAQQRLATDFYNAGKNAEAYRVILDAVKQKTEGADLKLSDTLEGQWRRAKNAAQAYLEELGKILVAQWRLKELAGGAADLLKPENIKRGSNPFGIYGALPMPPGTINPANDNSLSSAAGIHDIGAPNALGASAGLDDLAKSSEVAAERIAKINDALVVAARTAHMLPAELEIYNQQVAAGVAETDALGRAMLGTSDAARNIADQMREINAARLDAQLPALQRALDLARESTGIGQLNVQYQNRITELMEQQIPAAAAIRTAEAERAVTLAQVNAQSDRTLRSVQPQSALLTAAKKVSEGPKDERGDLPKAA